MGSNSLPPGHTVQTLDPKPEPRLVCLLQHSEHLLDVLTLTLWNVSKSLHGEDKTRAFSLATYGFVPEPGVIPLEM